MFSAVQPSRVFARGRAQDPCRQAVSRALTAKGWAISLGNDRFAGRWQVTGGAEFIGSNLVVKLLQLGFHVRVLDDLSTGDAGYLNVSDPRVELQVGTFVASRTVNSHGRRGLRLSPCSYEQSEAFLDRPCEWHIMRGRNAIGTGNVLQAAKAA